VGITSMVNKVRVNGDREIGTSEKSKPTPDAWRTAKGGSGNTDGAAGATRVYLPGLNRVSLFESEMTWEGEGYLKIG
jgi:hypothetical protein